MFFVFHHTEINLLLFQNYEIASAMDQKSPQSSLSQSADSFSWRAVGKIFIGVIIILGFLSATTYSLLFLIKKSPDVSYYKNVNELSPSEINSASKTLQLHGFVVKNSLDVTQGNLLKYKFSIENCEKSVVVTYTGTVPDAFKEGGEVVVRGKFEAGIFKATQITAKCPSKYQQEAPVQTQHCTR